MLSRAKLLEDSRQAVTKLIQRARVTHREVSDSGMHEMRTRVETVIADLNELADLLDQITADDDELFGKLDVVGDRLEEMNNVFLGDDEK